MEWIHARLRPLAAKGLRHWMWVALLVPSGILVGHFLGTWKELESARFSIYNSLQRITPYEPTHARRTVLVLIGDDEYWRGYLARRVPLKRDYLAALIRKLDLANPAVIALDIDLRTQTPDGQPADHPDYREETEKLLQAIRDVSARRTIVLPQPVIEAREPGRHQERRYLREPTLVDGLDLHKGKIKLGYVALNDDIRRIPLTLTLQDGSKILSFAAAIAERLDPKSLLDAQADENDGLPYGTYMPPESFLRLSADQVLRAAPEALEPALAHQVVIIGGAWHTVSFGKGPVIDTWRTPAGEMPGALLLGNYVEALYLGRTVKPWPKELGIGIEVLMTLVVAVLFARDYGFARNLGITLVLGVVLAILTILAWQNLGLFFDFFVPAVLLAGHAFIEQVEWKAKAGATGHL